MSTDTRRYLKSSRLFLAFFVASIAASSYGGTVSSANAEPARFEASPRPALPVLANARCGYLVVPEDRTQPTGRNIRLLVAIFPARSAPAKSDPVVYVAGGPGGIALAETPILDAPSTGHVHAAAARTCFLSSRQASTATRDLILMDQRETLYSEPALTCPDMDQFLRTVLGITQWNVFGGFPRHQSRTHADA
jgi:hypothetical protein